MVGLQATFHQYDEVYRQQRQQMCADLAAVAAGRELPVFSEPGHPPATQQGEEGGAGGRARSGRRVSSLGDEVTICCACDRCYCGVAGVLHLLPGGGGGGGQVQQQPRHPAAAQSRQLPAAQG